MDAGCWIAIYHPESIIQLGSGTLFLQKGLYNRYITLNCMLKYQDMKRLQNLFNELTGRKLGFSSVKNSDEWKVFEINEQVIYMVETIINDRVELRFTDTEFISMLEKETGLKLGDKKLIACSHGYDKTVDVVLHTVVDKDGR